MPAKVLARHASSRRRVALAISTPAGPTQDMGGVTAWRRGATPGSTDPSTLRSLTGGPRPSSGAVDLETPAALRCHVTARINDARLTQDESHGPARWNRRPRSRRAAHKARRPSTAWGGEGEREAKSRQELVAGVARTRPESEGEGASERASERWPRRSSRRRSRCWRRSRTSSTAAGAAAHRRRRTRTTTARRRRPR